MGNRKLGIQKRVFDSKTVFVVPALNEEVGLGLVLDVMHAHMIRDLRKEVRLKLS
jgi:hypothetical protein